MWNETNFLFKGFINEVKGALSESNGSGGLKPNERVYQIGFAESKGLVFTNGSFASSVSGSMD